MNRFHITILAIACATGIQANASTITVNFSFAGAGTPAGPPVGTTRTLDGHATGSMLSGNPALDAVWNPVTYDDHSVVDLTTKLLNGTFSMAFADGDTLSGNLFEDLTRTNAGVGPYTQTFTITAGTGQFAGATGSLSSAAVGGSNGFTTLGSGTINAPTVPEPAPGTLLLGALTVTLFAFRRCKAKSSRLLTR